MNIPDEVLHGCPYCGRALRYVVNRWFGHNVFECDQCGNFPDYRTIAAPEAGSSETSKATSPKSLVVPHVLFVDDSDEQRDLYAAMLEPVAKVVAAARGEEALALAAGDPPDVILLDVMMPGMDGWETCRRLKANPATSRIPVIMLTSLDGVDVPARARRAGAIAVLMKPCPLERLVLTIDAARR
jgi:CheY-like chemotaxis protein